MIYSVQECVFGGRGAGKGQDADTHYAWFISMLLQKKKKTMFVFVIFHQNVITCSTFEITFFLADITGQLNNETFSKL